MKQLLMIVLLVQACAMREPFRPRHTARDMVEQHLDCDDVEIARASDNPYLRDPLARRTERWVAWGCGQLVRLECDPFGTRNGSCRDDVSYEAPAIERPQGIVKIEARYYTTEGVAQRETYRVEGRGEIVRARDEGALAFPVEAGIAHLSIGSDPVLRRIQHHHWTTTSTERRGDRTYNVTRFHHATSVHHYTETGCNQTLHLQVEPDASYRVLFEYGGRGQCQVSCAREVETPRGTALIQCSL